MSIEDPNVAGGFNDDGITNMSDSNPATETDFFGNPIPVGWADERSKR